MTSAGITLAVLMSLAVAYFIGGYTQRRSYEQGVIRRREALLGPVLRLEGPRVSVKALSAEELDQMRIRRPKSNLIRLTERAIERRRIVEEVHPWRQAAE